MVHLQFSAFPPPVQYTPLSGGEETDWLLSCEERTSHQFAGNHPDMQLAGSHNAQYCYFVLGLYGMPE
jgi:hypothetical protein